MAVCRNFHNYLCFVFTSDHIFEQLKACGEYWTLFGFKLCMQMTVTTRRYEQWLELNDRYVFVCRPMTCNFQTATNFFVAVVVEVVGLCIIIIKIIALLERCENTHFTIQIAHLQFGMICMI